MPYDSFAPNPNTRDGKTLMTPAPGSIPAGLLAAPLRPGPRGGRRAPAAELKNPYPVLGGGAVAQARWPSTRYCSHCHGAGGLGDGLVTARFPRPPSLLAEHARGLPDGQLFHIITHGQGLMPAHGSQVAPEDRWKIVHYLRSPAASADCATAQKEMP